MTGLFCRAVEYGLFAFHFKQNGGHSRFFFYKYLATLRQKCGSLIGSVSVEG